MPDKKNKAATRRENLFYRKRSRERIARSPLPPALAKTLSLLLDHMGSATDYTLAWLSHATLAEKQGGVSERTIERHCEALRVSDLIRVKKRGLVEARLFLKQEFGYT